MKSGQLWNVGATGEVEMAILENERLASYRGKSIEEMTREELIGTVQAMYKMYERALRDHRQEREVMTRFREARTNGR